LQASPQPIHHQQKKIRANPLGAEKGAGNGTLKEKELNFDFSEGTDVGVTLIVVVSEVGVLAAEVFVLTVR
jgi:hypothetical protein